MKFSEKIRRCLNEADPYGTEDVDWDTVRDAIEGAAKDIHGKVDKKLIDGIMKNLYKHKPNDTENAIQIGVDMLRANSEGKENVSGIMEKIDKYLKKNMNEAGPISKEGALKFVFKLPKEGEFTAEFLDGTKTTINVDPEDKSAGNYAFIGKDHGSIFQSWKNKPSKEEAHDVLARVKSPKHGKVED